MEEIQPEPSGRVPRARDTSLRSGGPSSFSAASTAWMAATSSSEPGSSSSFARSREPAGAPLAAVVSAIAKGKDPVVVVVVSQECEHARGEEEQEQEVDASIFTSVDSYDDGGEPSTFAGASHPPEPVDADTFRTVYLPIEQSMPPEPPAPPPQPSACLVKGLQQSAAGTNGGPFVDDLSSRIHCRKQQQQQSAAAVVVPMSPTDSLVEEMAELGRPSSRFSLRRASRATTESTLAPPFGGDTEEKECVWDASLPPSVNASPARTSSRISIASSSRAMTTITSLSAANSCCTSTYRSNGTTSGADRNYASTIGSVIGGSSLESTKTSMSRPSDSSGLSDESTWSNATGSGSGVGGGASKPHKGNDPRWKSILAVRHRDGTLGMSHFRLLKRLGCGDIGSVYLSELSGTRCHFAMKVMDKASLASRKKLARAQTEREILQLLDHPFLPTLYTHFETDRFSCLVMEFCPGGDLHTLRQRQPGKHFSEYAARFYAAEVLLALEYLHMLGVVYRDLKPENVLVRDDGHIMLSDFDLSLRCSVSPTLIKTSSIGSSDHTKRQSSGGGGSFCVQPSCIEPTSVCIQPACFMPRLFAKKGTTITTTTTTSTIQHKSGSGSSSFRRQRSDVIGGSSSSQHHPNNNNTLPELVAEPTAARSTSFVGTHEYLAPEIIKREGHGSAVDWWTFGIFLHELLYGKTPFKGSDNRATMFNVVGQQLRFPDAPPTSYASRDLIRGLLVKEPQHRLGVKRGATEIKQHPFFEGVNWALIRCSTPPEVPRQPEHDQQYHHHHHHQQPPPRPSVKHGITNASAAAAVGPAAVGVRSASKRMVVGAADVKSEGKYLDFEFF